MPPDVSNVFRAPGCSGHASRKTVGAATSGDKDDCARMGTGENIMKKQLAILVGLGFLMATSAVDAAMVLTQSAQPANTSTLFSAVGTYNNGNHKARLEVSNPGGTSNPVLIQGGNPGNGWWGGTPRPVRSWEVAWDDATHEVSFKVYTTSDWTGDAAMTMTRTPVFATGGALVGLNIGARLTGCDKSVTIGNVQFDDGSGFANVATANATYSGDAWFNNYHAITGTLDDFVVRGTATYPTGTSTGDSMRFFVSGVQAVPEPSMMSLLAFGGLGLIRRKRSV